MPGTPHERGLRLDLTGLREEYARARPPTSRRAAALGALVTVACVAAVALVAALVTRDPGWVVRGVVLGGVAAALSHVTDRPGWRPRTLLRAEELEVHDGGLGGDRYAWWWVRQVTCAPSRRVPGRAVLGDGRRLRLHEMPAEDVERLARALERARAAGPGTGS